MHRDYLWNAASWPCQIWTRDAFNFSTHRKTLFTKLNQSKIFFFASPETFMLFIFLPIQKSLHDNNARYSEWWACVWEKEAQDLLGFLPIFLLQLVCLKKLRPSALVFIEKNPPCLGLLTRFILRSNKCVFLCNKWAQTIDSKMKASSVVDHRPKYSKILFRQISRILGEDVRFSNGTQNKSGKVAVLGDSFAMWKWTLSHLTDFLYCIVSFLIFGLIGREHPTQPTRWDKLTLWRWHAIGFDKLCWN